MPDPELTEADLTGAETVLGLGYTQAERAQMIENLKGQIGSARLIRRHGPPNGAPTASRIDPRLTGFWMPSGGSALRLSGSHP